MHRTWLPSRDVERGSVTVFVVGVLLALIVVAGLVFDGGTIIAGHREADAEAEGAARAAAEAVAATARSSAAVTVDPNAAHQAAERYLAAYGHQGQVAVAGDRVTVSVSLNERTQILSIVGLRSKTVTGQASATALVGGQGGVP
ncbi:MAG: pilus assembly protein TadG-related protein [Actinomycetota bacterium]|nr:pilus assembly protein TadG-related protein [Actinomycetota bacterium]